MTQQFYVSPEQLMKDRADFARKGIARGRSVVVISCPDGIALVAENPSPSLHKIGEIYDKIAFAAVGKYNEFESLRQAGVRYADVRGYSYDREDVTARGLASVYAQSLGAVFTAEQKPFEVELAVAEVGAHARTADHLYRLTFDGSIADEHGFIVMGGQAEQVAEAVARGLGGRTRFRRGHPRWPLAGSWRTRKRPPCRRPRWRSPCWTAARKAAAGRRRAFRRLEDADNRASAG